MKTIIVNGADSGQRADKYLMKYLNEAPKGFIYKMIRKKNITLNGKKMTGNEMLNPMDKFELFLSEDTLEKFSSPVNVNMDSGKLNVIYEDENMIAADKPAGVLTHSASPNDSDTMTHRLIKHLYESGCINKGGVFTPGFSNRLDRNTTGVVIAGKNPLTVRALNCAMVNRSILRYYQAIVHGELSGTGRLEGIYNKDSNANKASIENGGDIRNIAKKTASLEYESVISRNGYTLLNIKLITGRSHQIRAQLAEIGHPVAGDVKYGALHGKTLFRQMLHGGAVVINGMESELSYLNGLEIKASKPADFRNFENLYLMPST